jgi:3-hydroxyisobutyrate dehydrogenase-like beta-hydroxyacid dehydrogenase
MGSALVTGFLKQGHTVTVWNRTASRCAPLAAQGARVATSVQDAIAGADIVVGNVNDYATSDRLLRPAEPTKELRGRVFVQLASGTPRQAKETAEWAREHHIQYLDGAIMATPNFIGQPGCTILYSGARDVFEASKPALLALGGNAIYVGDDAGHASALDNALLIVLWGSLFGLFQGAAICEAEKIPLAIFKTTLKGVLPVIDGSLASALERIDERRFASDETTMATADTCHASVRLLLDLSKEHEIDHGLLAVLDRLFQKAHDRGQGQDDFAAVYQSLR